MRHKLFLFLILSPLLSMCQPIEIRGKIINEQNEPVTGASVTLKRTGHTTLSDNNGLFTIHDARLTDTLTISASGYEPVDVPNNERGLLTVILKPKVTALSEVIVHTGYETLPKERATGSFTTITKDQLQQQVSHDLVSRLEAIANSVTFYRKQTSSGQLMVRGLSTILGSKQPLIILDNFPYEGELENINPNDVESITILKDAAAASIWGTRAGNGVIVVTTKKGTLNQPLRIEFNTAFTTGEKPDLFYLPQINPSDFIDVEQFLFSRGYYNAQINSTNRPPLSPVVELLVKKANGSITPTEADAQINALRNYDIRNDYLQYMYQSSFNQQYALSLSGGSHNMGWKLFTGYDQNKDVLNNAYRRLNLNAQNIYRLGSKLQLNSGIMVSFSGTDAGSLGYNQIITANGSLPPYTRFADDEGNALPVIANYRQAYIDTAGGGLLLDWNFYPLLESRQTSRKTNNLHLLANAGLQYRLFNFLMADLSYQYETENIGRETIYNPESYFARNLVNLYSQINRTTGQVVYKIPRGGILDLGTDNLVTHNARAQFKVNKSFGIHFLTALAGTELRDITTTGNSYRTYGFNPEILTSAEVDFTTSYPRMVGGSAFISNSKTNSGKLNRFISFYANAAYSLLDKYTLTLSGRRDASNLFGLNTNDKWTPLWSAGLGWELTKESFFKQNKFALLKLRATYGYSGNVDQSRSGEPTIQYASNSPYTLTPTARPDRFSNPDLRWEKVRTANLGLDFRISGERLGGSMEYYIKTGLDLYGTSPVDYTTVSTTNIIKNVASMQAKGLDIELHSLNLNGKFRWTTDFNFNHYRDKVLEYFLTTKQGSNFISNGSIFGAVEDKPLFPVYSFHWAGLDPATGEPRGYYADTISKNYTLLTGMATTIDDLFFHGPAMPSFFGSMGNTFSWKGISVTARLMYRFGYYFRRSSIVYNQLFSSRRGHEDFAYRWQQPGDEQFTNVPAMLYPSVINRDNFYNSSSVLVERGDHIRLQYVRLDYTLDQQQWKLLPFKNINVFLTANNLGIIWKKTKTKWDPDYPTDVIPPSKTFSFGLRTTL